MRQKEPVPILRLIKDLEIGDTIHLPISELMSTKAMASTYAAQADKSFSTKLSRETRTFSVTRTR